MKKKLCGFLSFLVVFSLFLPTALAATNHTYSYTSVNTGQSWTTQSSTTTYAPMYTGYRLKTVTTKYKASGTHYTAVYGCTQNFFHTNGVADLTTTITVTDTHTINTSLSGEAASFGASLGYQYSYQSSTSVQAQIDPAKPSDYYYYGMKTRLRDFKVLKVQTSQKLTNGSWVSYSTSQTLNHAVRVDYTGSGALPGYYNWYVSP